MSVWQKVCFNYAAVFGFVITFLTICGYWDSASVFLKENRLFGLLISMFHLIFAYIYYHSEKALSKIKFDQERE